jgi:uncharacterized protein YaaW (UPF0174 family)
MGDSGNSALGGNYELDKDLSPVLAKASNDDLEPIVMAVLKASSENLSDDPLFKLHRPNHAKYAQSIEREIKLFGGNTVANWFRGGSGPTYHGIVCDVAKRMGAEFEKDSPIEVVEMAIIVKALGTAFEKMTDEQRLEFIRSFNEAGVSLPEFAEILGGKGKVPKAAFMGAMQAAIRLGGFASYQIAVIAANAIARLVIGRGLAFGANMALTRTVAVIAGPIGWTLSTLWLAYDVAGPAFRVTIPCVFIIAALRLQQRIELPADSMPRWEDAPMPDMPVQDEGEKGAGDAKR